MSRRNKNASGATAYTANPPTGGNTGGSGGGGTRFTLSSPINIALGKKGITVTGAEIQTINAPLRQKQVQPQAQPQQGQWSGGGSQQVLTACLQSAAQMTLFAQQAAIAGNHQLAQQLTQSSQQLLSQLGQSMGTTGGKQSFTMPQQEYAGQQKQSRSRKQRQSTNQQGKVLQPA